MGVPQNPFFGPTAQVRGDQAQGEHGLDDEVAVRDSIEGIGAQAVKAKLGLDAAAIDGQRGSR